MLTPAFHFRILNDFLPIITEHADILIEKLSKLTVNGRSEEVDIVKYITLCTLDVICETAMGIKVRGQEEESEYVNCLHQVSELILVRLSRPWLWPDFAFFCSPHGRRFKRCLKVMKSFTMKVIEERRDEWLLKRKIGHPSDDQRKRADYDSLNNSNNNQECDSYSRKRMAFLDILLEHHLDNNFFTIDDVREEVDTFMFAVNKLLVWANQSLKAFLSRVMTLLPCPLAGHSTYWAYTRKSRRKFAGKLMIFWIKKAIRTAALLLIS